MQARSPPGNPWGAGRAYRSAGLLVRAVQPGGRPRADAGRIGRAGAAVRHARGIRGGPAALLRARSLALRTGGELRPALSVEEAARTSLPEAHQELAAQMRTRWVVGPPDAAAAAIRDLAQRYAVAEVMINPVAGASEADPLDRVPAREQTVRLLAATLGRS